MAISWMDAGALNALLDGGVYVAIANTAGLESGAELLGAVLALHDESGSPQIRRATELSLSAGESYAFDEDRPVAVSVIGVEATLRVASPIAHAIAEIYLRSDANRTEPIERMEIGIISSEDAPSDAVPIPEIEGLSAYIKLEP
jgi:hypothetical protein